MRASEIVGLGNGGCDDGQLSPLLPQVDALLDALGVDPNTLLARVVGA